MPVTLLSDMHPSLYTSMGSVAHLGSITIDGRERALGVTCFTNGMPCLLAVDPDGQVYSRLNTNLDPWPDKVLSPWHVLVNGDLGATGAAALASMDGLVALPTGQMLEVGRRALHEVVVMPWRWRRDAVGDLHCVRAGLSVDVEQIETGGWLVFLNGVHVEELGELPSVAAGALAALSLLREMRRTDEAVVDRQMLALPRPHGAPCPQIG